MQSLKSLLITMIILGGAFLAYDCYLAPDADKIVFKRTARAKTVARPIPPKPAAKSVETAMTPVSTSSPGRPPAHVTPGARASTSPLPPTVATDAFAPPAIPDVIQATQNWKHIPPSAFPRVVKLNKPMTFTARFGSTQVAAGASVTAVAARNHVLTVAPNGASSLRGTAPIDDTDLKLVLTELYDAWRAKRIEQARRAWAEQKNVPAPAAERAAAVAGDGRPLMIADGSYPLLLASMKSGEVTEITPHNITKWGGATPGEFKGRKCWEVTVEFDASTAFGNFSTSAVAKVVDGKVATWTYRGSGETVP